MFCPSKMSDSFIQNCKFHIIKNKKKNKKKKKKKRRRKEKEQKKEKKEKKKKKKEKKKKKKMMMIIIMIMMMMMMYQGRRVRQDSLERLEFLDDLALLVIPDLLVLVDHQEYVEIQDQWDAHQDQEYRDVQVLQALEEVQDQQVNTG